ncbi:MAG: lysophospholipid acyltransferase family protein [Crocinitomicaceae bacterium]|nr:lysophospholipid acyltransferase family protein [Crocinitomicaceae bacterium]MDG1777563.1 lysophospholipid acyltransferase family protein [Crocinitomicaceae bacterium]
MAKFGYYLFIIPLSYLPLPVLYILTDIFYLLIITVIPYRRRVVEKNIERSFPNKSKRERKRIKLKFYRHLTDLLAEGIKSITISESGIHKRIKVVNPEVMDRLYAKKQNVILVSGHYNNWEWVVNGQDLLFKHKAIGIGMPLSSKFWDKKINERRSRFGMTVVHAKNYKAELEKRKAEVKAILVLSDQSPGNSLKSYWMDFLNQKTAVLFGAELMANTLDYPVVFFALKKVKRGSYTMKLTLITEKPTELKWGEITVSHTKLLEEEIVSNPQYWLWSHKRWKREMPGNIESLKNEQREKFNTKFNR